LQFESDPEFELKFESLEVIRSGIELLTVQMVGEKNQATVFVPEGKLDTAAALEKYLGSGLVKDVDPKTAKKIVSHFGNKTLIPNRFKSNTFTPL
jgi:hypothetical protein